MIARFGLRATLCSAFGGETGDVVRTLIEREHVVVQAVSCASPNGAYVHDRRGGGRQEIAAATTGRLSRHEVDELYGAALVAGLDADACVLTGSPDDVMPADVYRRLASDLKTNGTLTIADLSGANLEAALAGGVQIVKLSDEELVTGGYAASAACDDVLAGIEQLRRCGAHNVVVSRAAEPTIAWIGERPVEVRTPRLEELDPRGAGDSMTATLAAALASNLPNETALRLAAAAGSLNVTRRGLATGHRASIEQLAEHVEIRELSDTLSRADETGA